MLSVFGVELFELCDEDEASTLAVQRKEFHIVLWLNFSIESVGIRQDHSSKLFGLIQQKEFSSQR